jgi:putative ABC transport system permease protein
MGLLLTLRVALLALGKNKLRSGLTVLGVVIGVAAVILIVSLGQSARSLIQAEMQGLGTNVVIVFSGSGKNGGVRGGRGSVPTLTTEDAEAILRECGSLLAVSPVVGGREQAIYGNVNWNPNEILGVTKDYLVVRNWDLRAGGFFSGREVRSAAKVCVIGQTVVEKLFQTTNPLGKEIRIKNIPFLVVGVLEPKGANLVGEDQDDIILAPYTTVRTRLRGSYFDKVDVIFTSARTASLMDQAEQEIHQLLQERHHVRFGDPPTSRSTPPRSSPTSWAWSPGR